jgi:hypothetical protein
MRIVPRLSLSVIFVLAASVDTLAAEKYAQVLVEPDGRVIVVTQDGRRLPQKKDRDQTEASAGAISPDGQSAGWLALYPYASASYSIPMKLMILTNGRVRTLVSSVGLPIWYWSFQEGGRRVAYHSETTHGGLGERYELRDVARGLLIAEYTPEYDRAGRVAARPNEPTWVKELDAAQQKQR